MVRPPCCNNDNLKKGPWTPEEDEKLVDYINRHGRANWNALPKLAGLNRCGKSYTLRWIKYLRPDIKRGKFSEEEERNIINLHSVLGNKRPRIAARLRGRTDNDIKNFWNTHISKKFLQMGIDPNTHKPRTDLNHLLNLSQLLGPTQFGNFMGPWNNFPTLQADANQLAKFQLLQYLLQIMNTSTFVSVGNTSLLGSRSLNPIEGYNVQHTPSTKEPIPPSQDLRNPSVSPQAPSDLQVMNNIMECYEGGNVPGLGAVDVINNTLSGWLL